jgi:hypothetical protein
VFSSASSVDGGVKSVEVGMRSAEGEVSSAPGLALGGLRMQIQKSATAMKINAHMQIHTLYVLYVCKHVYYTYTYADTK